MVQFIFKAAAEVHVSPPCGWQVYEKTNNEPCNFINITYSFLEACNTHYCAVSSPALSATMDLEFSICPPCGWL